MSDIFSNASNFNDFTTTGVDPRTGMFNAQLKIASLSSAKTSGIPYDLVINYNASSNFDLGFGRGWNYNISSFYYNRNKSMLSLISGQTFEIKWDAGLNEYIFPYRKIRDIKVLYLEETNDTPESIVVHYKDGTIDYIDYNKGTLYRRASPQGLFIHFEYANSYGPSNGSPTLWRISDDFGQSIEIDWWSDSYETLITHQISGKIARTCMVSKIGLGGWKGLGSISYCDEKSYTEFQYSWIESSNYEVITKVIHSSGLEEEVSYLNEGHTLPSNAPIDKVPFVTKHILYPGENQEVKTTCYEYSDKNYLGFGSSGVFESGQDTLFKVESDYKYESKEIVNNHYQVKRVYNKYHLLDTVIYTHNGSIFKEVTYTYFANLELGIESQPPTYSLLNKESITYYNDLNESINFSKEYIYDDFANLLKLVDKDGSITNFSYYSSEGEDGCPPNQSKFVTYIKEKKFVPALDISNPRSETFTYTSIPRLDDKGKTFILLDTVHDHSGKIIKTNTYFDSVNDPLTYGRTKEELTSLNGKHTKLTFEYHFEDDYIETIYNLVSYDGCERSECELVDFINRKPIRVVDSTGVAINFEYDPLGRKVKETISPDTIYESIKTYFYDINDKSSSIHLTDTKGNVHITKFNGAGLPISIEFSGNQTQEMHYNEFGLLIEESKFDYFSDYSISLKTNYTYDASGNVNRVEHGDGRIEIIEHDIPSLTSKNEMCGLLVETSVFDIFGNVIYHENRCNLGALLSCSNYSYDGYSNLLSHTDTNGRETLFSYDNLDRLTTTVRKCDGLEYLESISYSPYLDINTPIEVTINGKTLATRQLDGLGRKVSENSARGQRSWTYTSGHSFPHIEKTPSGETLTRNYNNDLGTLISLEAEYEADLIRLYQYDNTSGDLKKSENIGSSHSYVHDSVGRVVEETVKLSDNVERKASYTYSKMGRLESKTDFFNNKTVYIYDAIGRLQTISSEVSDKTFLTTVTYDDFSRPSRYSMNIDDQNSIELELQYNSLGMETSRKFVSNSYSLFITNNLNSDLLISERSITDSNNNNLNEHYYYDDLDRLVRYQCNGLGSPSDEYGNTITEQNFSHDKYGNMLQIKSIFSDGSFNIMNFTYDNEKQERLSHVTNTHPNYPSSVAFHYDSAGNMLNDEKGLSYIYNALDQVSSVTHNGKTLSEYEYDAFGKIISQTVDGMLEYFIYQQNELKHEVSASSYTLHESNEGIAHSSIISDKEIQHDLLFTDAQGSVLTEVKKYSDGTTSNKNRRYTAYGEEESTNE